MPGFWREPPFGSTAWAQQQFRRMIRLDDELAAERRRLTAEGWQPPEPDAPAFRDRPAFDDGREAVAAHVQRDIDYRRALQEEARRRVAARRAQEALAAPGQPQPQAVSPDPGAEERAPGGFAG